MKKISYALMITVLLSNLTAKSQDYAREDLTSTTPGKKWQIIQFDFGLGVSHDQYESMSLEELLIFAKNPAQLSRDLDNFQEENTTYTADLGFFGNLSFSPVEKNLRSRRIDQELRIGFGMHSPKEAMVSYKNEALDTSIVYCNSHGEFTLEGAYLYRGKWGKRFHWYLGYGANFGFTFSNEIIISYGKYFAPGEHPSMQENDETRIERYRAKPVIYSRLYIPYGIHYGLNDKWSIGFDLKTGIGWQKIRGESSNFIEETGAFIIGAKYRLQ